MSGIKLSGALPDGERNGLSSIAPALAENPEGVYVAVVLLDVVKLITSVDSGDVVPTVRVRAIEPMGANDTADATELRRLLRRAHERRTGRVVLPLDLEDELSSLGPASEDEPETRPETDPESGEAGKDQDGGW